MLKIAYFCTEHLLVWVHKSATYEMQTKMQCAVRWLETVQKSSMERSTQQMPQYTVLVCQLALASAR